MLCGPLAIEAATGVDHRTIVTSIRAAREDRGERVSLRGGTSWYELQDALSDLGWEMRLEFRRKRVSLPDLNRRIHKGRWLFRQSGHFFGVRSAAELKRIARRHKRVNCRRITHAWELIKH